MRVLVTYATRLGGVGAVAESIAQALDALGIEARVSSIHETHAIDCYDGVVVGGALYARRWPRNARQFIRRNGDALRSRPVFFFSIGPLDYAEREHDEAIASPHVQKLMEKIGARRHVVFGGRLDADGSNFVLGTMTNQQHPHDWRDWEHIQRYADAICAAVMGQALHAP